MFYQTPLTYYSLNKKMIELNLNYPFLGLSSIGKSTQKRDILCFKIGNMDNPTLFAGAFHSLEWLTSLVLIKFCESLCAAYSKDEKIYDLNLKEVFRNRGLIIVPCVNVDGVNMVNTSIESAGKYQKVIEKSGAELSRWQANIRGIDLNHNYNAGYDILKKMETEKGLISPGPTMYGGKKYESEKETKAMVKLCDKYNFNKVVAFHSQGEEIYYKYGENTPSHSKYIATIIGQLSGYLVCEPEGMASHGGFKDWFIDKHKKSGFTLEIGNGKNPLPIEDLESVYEKLERALFLFPVL